MVRMVGLLAHRIGVLAAPLMAAMVLARTNQEKIDEAIRSGDRKVLLGSILVVTGLVVMIAGIPLGIWWDRRKKARKRAEREKGEAPPTV